MLQNLRDQKNSALIIILFALIIIVFIFMFGLPSTDSTHSQARGNVGSVNGKKISYDMMRTMVLNYNDDNILGTMQYPRVAYQTTEAIGVVYLLADEARNAGLRVSDEELHDYITNWEAGNPDVLRLGFLRKNKFDKRSYEDALRRMQLSARDYEAYKRDELLARRYLTLLSSAIAVSDASLWSAFAEANTTADLEIIRLTPADVLKTIKPVTPEELVAYTTSNAADVQAYYDAHIDDYTTPEKLKLQQITIRKSLDALDKINEKMKTFQPAERFSIIRSKVAEPNADFDQIFAEYDESDNKELKGVSALLPVEIMAQEIQDATAGKKIGEQFTAELGDKYVIGKVLERTEKIVKPMDEVKFEIAAKIITDARIKARTDEVTANILAQSPEQPLASRLTSTLYAGIALEQPALPTVVETTPDATGEATQPLPTPDPNLIVVPEFERVRVENINDITINSGFLQGIGTNEDLARDIRTAPDQTLLSKTYTIGENTFIVRVVKKNPADQQLFLDNLEDIRYNAIAAKSQLLIGNIDSILTVGDTNREPYGVWLEEKIQAAKASGKFRISNETFNKMADQIQKRQAREAAED